MFYKRDIMQFFSADTTMFFVRKTALKSFSWSSQFFFSTANRPKISPNINFCSIKNAHCAAYQPKIFSRLLGKSALIAQTFFYVKNICNISKLLKQGWLNYKNLSYVVRQINRKKIRDWVVKPARATNSIFLFFLGGGILFEHLFWEWLCRPKKCSK